jgi:putative transposase
LGDAVIVGMRTCGQAARVAALTGGVQLPGKPSRDGTARLSRLVDVGPDFEVHRAAVEPVPTGWMVTAAKFEVEWPVDDERGRSIRSHFGARRKAFNWGLRQVKADMDAKTLDPGHESIEWTQAALRKAWNHAKDDVAPWWAENSKEAYSSGLADVETALRNWKASTTGKRKGRRLGFPRFKSSRRDHGRVRFHTGAMRVEPDRRTITVPVIGGLRSKENTRRVQRHVAAGRARILNMTLSEQWGRLFVSVNYAQRTPTSPRAQLPSPPLRLVWIWACGPWPPSTPPPAPKH